MLSATTKETYYNCSNDECCHQFKTMEGDPVTLALPIKGGLATPISQQRKMRFSKKEREGMTPAPENRITTIHPGRTIHILAG